MKEFLKFTLATVVGIVLSGAVLFFIGMIAVLGIATSSQNEVTVKDDSVMFLELNGSLVERSEDNPFAQLFQEQLASYGLDDIISSIKKAKENEKIKGIYLQVNSLGASFASLEEIRNALLDFKESGKFIVSYADMYSQGLYYLSSVSDKVILNPLGSVEWQGLSMQPMFFKNLLDKVGVEMQVFRVGTYKSAVEPFISTEMSPANREQLTALIGSIWGQLLKDISASRNIPADSLNAYADKMLTFYPAEESVKCGLVDTLLYKDGVRSYLKHLLKSPEDKGISALTLEEMKNVGKSTPKDKSGNIVAVYYACGEIDSSPTDGIVSKEVVKDLRKLREDENVKAVVLRVNSPGGSAFGSEQIWHEVILLKAKKPVIVSMGDYAASGGYYISCAADYIFAQPTTLTGSIGVFGLIPNVKGLTDKIGIDFDVVKTNKYADFGTLGRGLNNDEKALVQMSVNNTYNLFLTRCADGRNMKVGAVEKVAEGRVWSGIEAKELKLVDELGGLGDAVRMAVEKAKVEGYTLMNYPEKKSFFDNLMETKGTNYIQAQLIENFGEYYKCFNLIKSLKNVDRVQARIPFEANIH